ncbi:MAG: hypothetical protein RLZZ628_2980 [Bacteroidota bacterium]|jgi:hypothetical protein
MIKNIKRWIVCFAIIELLLLTYARNFFGIFVSPVIILLNGLVMGILSLWYAKNANLLPPTVEKPAKWQILTLITTAIMGGITILNLAKAVFRTIPVEVKYSDIIPLLQKMVSNFLTGKEVYKNFNDFGYDLFPTYLPAQWMPFLIAEKWKTDYRMTATIILLCALAYFFYKIIQSNLSFIQKILLILLSCGFIDTFLWSDGFTIAVSIEQMIMGYYILLCTVLATSKNPFLRGATIALCLLSRFSFLFWLPMYLFCVFLSEGKKPFLKIMVPILMAVLILYVPHLLKDPYIFLKAQKAYSGAAVGEWSRADAPPHLVNGLGLATHFKFLLGGTTEIKIKILQLTNVLLSVGVSSLLALFFIKNRFQLNMPIFNIASLKILMTIFYALIQVPYSYLFYIPIGITILLIFSIFNTVTSSNRLIANEI